MCYIWKDDDIMTDDDIYANMRTTIQRSLKHVNT